MLVRLEGSSWLGLRGLSPDQGEQCLGPSQTVCVLCCTEGIFLKAADVSMAGVLGGGLFSLQEEAIAASLRDEGQLVRLEFCDRLLHFTSHPTQVVEHCG